MHPKVIGFFLLSWIMQNSRVLLLFLCLPVIAIGQTGKSQQKALNMCVDYANQSADEVASIVKSIIEYYPDIHRKSSWGPPRYVCPVQSDNYYFNTAIDNSKTIPAATVSKLKTLRSAADKIEETCKALDTYHKLEDYKQDNFAKAESLISELQVLIIDYKKKQQDLRSSLEAEFEKIPGVPGQTSYSLADSKMLAQISRESNLIDSWTFNLKEEMSTGWPIEKLQQSIAETDNQLADLKRNTPKLNYPASSMWPHFQESLTSILELKRNALDGYNAEAKKSDKHSNDTYLDLINYFNGMLVADYNTFIQFSERDGYSGLKTVKYVPAFEIRSESKPVRTEVKTFQDIQFSPVKILNQKSAIMKPAFEALTNYIDFINESWRQINYLQSVLTNLSSSAAYFKTLPSFNNRAPMHIDFKDYQVPLSKYQKTISDSKNLSPDLATVLNEKATALLDILKEMEWQNTSLEKEIQERRYEKDHLANIYLILDQQKKLSANWDKIKELLYQDLRAIYNAYPPVNASNSWYVSGKALRELTDLDHDALFTAKKYYENNTTVTIETEKIDQTLRAVIANEYENMKGIQKIGRNNGLCPYTPYEDLPETSKRLSDEFKKLKPAKGSSGYSHPYHTMVYMYNDIVDDYNKFCELSTETLHLKTIKQPELFEIKYPQQNTKIRPTASSEETVSVTFEKDSAHAEPKISDPKEKIKTVRDTVYIEKHDTVYLAEPADKIRSMEGYATNNMVLLLDVSGSMNTPDKLPLLKSSVLNIIAMMRPEDKISIIAFSGKPKVLLASSSFKEEEKIKKAIRDLTSSGKTDGNAGLKLAYKVADGSYIRGGNNRIILATDGEFGLNEETLKLIEKFSSADIFLSVFNFGKGMGSSRSLENLAALGKGNYESITKENVELKLIREAKAKKKK